MSSWEIIGVIGEQLRPCDMKNLTDSCGPNESCVLRNGSSTARCECKRGYEFIKGACTFVASTIPIIVDPTTSKPETKPSSGGSSVAAHLLVPVFLIVIACLVYVGARRYKWLQRFQQYRQNRYGNVLVTREDDDDDPPLA
ncbi:uncharacterized protein LOC105694186 isoform X2 [Orussus abietinus]|uniref:uncharacterized protein LOC105694186 isoform X2 n=1 Tax=Orussus abietinus TaxID=222816 RepID=UPI000625A3F3|nr:uncharacterized protein LOC105694186 isoform X2 [Orussus abietinus]XP_012270040.1 uncharacterized protein LOC105694186 isoform X2 [Orussus abietinus]